MLKKIGLGVFLLVAVAIIVFSVRYFLSPNMVVDQAAAEKAKAENPLIFDRHQLIDCSALMAVHESQLNGALNEGSPTLNLVGYGLGKAQELALKASEPAAAVRAEYDQKTLSYFMAYSADKSLTTHNALRFTQCHELLSQFEPDAQIQAAVKKAQSMAQ